jgi:hypothetical protein
MNYISRNDKFGGGFSTGQCLSYILAISLLIATGIGYRIAGAKLETAMEAEIELPVPLSTFPYRIGGWVGSDIEIPEMIQRVADNDDFLSRSYRHKLTNAGASLYVAFTGRPRTMRGHRPVKCYTAAGWNYLGTDESSITTVSGRALPCQIHRFNRIEPFRDEVFVLNFYILNGHIVNSESGFSGIGAHAPNFEGELANYVAQVQISSTTQSSVENLGSTVADKIITYFPDPNGVVPIVNSLEK